MRLIKKARQLALLSVTGFLSSRIWMFLFSLAAGMAMAAPAWADTTFTSQTGAQVEQALVNILNTVIEPIGGVVIFVVVAWTAFQMIVTAHRPEERSKVMGSLPYILAGGILLGGVMLFSGFIVGLATQVSSYQSSAAP